MRTMKMTRMLTMIAQPNFLMNAHTRWREHSDREQCLSSFTQKLRKNVATFCTVSAQPMLSQVKSCNACNKISTTWMELVRKLCQSTQGLKPGILIFIQ